MIARVRRQRQALSLTLACLLALAAVAVGSGCGGGDDTSAASLKDQLLPAKQLSPLKIESNFEWDNPIDFVVQGLNLPESTAPSEVIGSIDDAGFEAAAGQLLATKQGDPTANVDVAGFDSEDGAREARDVLHQEDLKQPCIAECVVNPREYKAKGIPDSVGVHLVPIDRPAPPGLSKFEAYHVEFTIGKDLYVVEAFGPPGSIPEARFQSGAKTFYEYASSHD
jgi:hypothetical protein